MLSLETRSQARKSVKHADTFVRCAYTSQPHFASRRDAPFTEGEFTVQSVGGFSTPVAPQRPDPNFWDRP